MVSRAMGSRLMIAGHKGNTKYVQMKKLIVYYFSGLSNRINFRPVINNPSSLLAGKCNAVNVSQVLVELCDIVKYSCCKKYQTKTWMVHLSTDLNSPVPNILTKSELGWTNGYDLVLCENSDKKLSLKSSSDVVGNPAATDCDLDKGERNKLSDQKHVNVADSNGNSTSAIDFQIDESNDSEDTRVKREIASLDQYLSLDCEFVGDLPKVSTDKQLGNYLGGCSIVDFDGNVVYDMKICEKDTITDCGTRYSGRHAGHNIDGVTFEDVRNTVTNLLKGKILVGYDVKHDLRVLQIEHPAEMTRDVQFNGSMRKNAADLGCQNGSLKSVSLCLLGRNIQRRPAHNSVEDATATMDLFKLVREEWEKCLTNPDCIDTDTLVREEWEKCLTNPDCIDTDTLVREKWEKCLTNSDCLDTDTLAREEWEKCLTNPDCIDTDTLVREEWEKCLTNPDFIDTDTLVREEWEKCLTNPVCIDSDTLVREEWEKCLTNSDSIDTDTLVREKWEKCLTNSDCLDTDTPTPPPSLTQPIDCLSVEDKAPRTDISDDSERENHIENKMKPHTSSQDRMKEKVLNPVKFLHKNCRSLGWDPPVYRFDSLTQETFICKVLVNGREYHSEVCSTHKEAKSSAAQAFFTHHQRSETDTYIDIMGQFFSNTKVEKYSGLDVVSALNIAAQKFGWVPRYQFDTLPSGQCVCKALIDGKEYWSGPCSDEKEAKFAAAETFFACHQKSENDTYTEMLQSWMKKPRKKSQAAEVHDGMSPGFFLHTTCVKHHWPIPVYKLVSKTRYEGHYQYIYKVVIHKKEFYGKEKNNWKLAKQDAAKTCISELKQICYIDS